MEEKSIIFTMLTFEVFLFTKLLKTVYWISVISQTLVNDGDAGAISIQILDPCEFSNSEKIYYEPGNLYILELKRHEIYVNISRQIIQYDTQG